RGTRPTHRPPSTATCICMETTGPVHRFYKQANNPIGILGMGYSYLGAQINSSSKSNPLF
ncbi:MAG: hypothetical protein OEX00_05175, partial [Gammaproteobacteria bacterium]|nr:hypothetical protein [Gammaproteobacteria bacterium]